MICRCSDRDEQAIRLSFHGGLLSNVFIARFLALLPGFSGLDLLSSSHLFNGAGAGREPSDAQERLALFQDIILFRRQQSLTADLLI
jgi:hypothetical protein